MSMEKFSDDFTELQKFISGLYAEYDNKTPLSVKESAQEKELASIRSTLGDERFYFIIDVPAFEIKKMEGIQRWLGYKESEFTLKKYWNQVVHTTSKTSMLLIVKQMYQLLSSGHFKLCFMTQRFSTKIALKHADGRILLAKKTSAIFQFDKHNKLLEYINEFTLVGLYKNEVIEPRIFNTSGKTEEAYQAEILKKSMNFFLSMKIFSAGELQIARKLAYTPGITQLRIAKELNLSVHTVDTYYKRFLIKSRDFFKKEELKSANEAAHLLKDLGLL